MISRSKMDGWIRGREETSLRRDVDEVSDEDASDMSTA